MNNPTTYERHFVQGTVVPVTPSVLFAYLDDHRRMSAHMGRRSILMAGSRMSLSTDAGGGQVVGSHITLNGSFLGVRLYLDEVVTRREPDRLKEWETVGEPKLIVIGSYRLGFVIVPSTDESRLCVAIDYRLPRRRWLGRLLGGFYARWCVRQMLNDADREFRRPSRVRPALG